jgi:hypothetical protein
VPTTGQQVAWRSNPTIPDCIGFFGAYLNHDYHLSGDSNKNVVNSYIQNTSTDDHRDLSAEITRFCGAYSDDLDASLSASYGFHFDPTLWEHIAASFLQLVQRLLQRDKPLTRSPSRSKPHRKHASPSHRSLRMICAALTPPVSAGTAPNRI